MQITQPVGRFLLSRADLEKRFHDHPNSSSHDLANQFKTGVLDVQLLLDAGLQVPDVLGECSVVGVRFSASTMNFSSRRRESVFSVYDAHGNHLGHYLSSAFKALMV
ncbi:hypothetical protein LJR129_005032 [Acidovorax sp. LjRoot129]|uniref:hypothetical protein n=1 Tax=unclassified Acidovorax TaxID=2684926 RepID=UPI003ED01B32